MALTPPRDAARGLIQEDSLLDEALSIESTASVAFKFTVSTRTDSLRRTRFSITSCAIQFPRHDPLSFQIGYPTQTDTISTEPHICLPGPIVPHIMVMAMQHRLTPNHLSQ